jgi:hypothetical protein
MIKYVIKLRLLKYSTSYEIPFICHQVQKVFPVFCVCPLTQSSAHAHCRSSSNHDIFINGAPPAISHHWTLVNSKSITHSFSSSINTYCGYPIIPTSLQLNSSASLFSSFSLATLFHT